MRCTATSLMILTLLLGGCRWPGDWYRVEPLIVDAKTMSAGSKGPALTYDEVEAWEEKATTRELRNAYLEKLLARSEMICSTHMSEVAATGGAVGFGGSWTAAIFSSLASITGGAAKSYS